VKILVLGAGVIAASVADNWGGHGTLGWTLACGSGKALVGA
jgi:hypothetical protein